MPHRRTAFFISDRTGITAEMLGHSLLTQFEGVEFKRVTLPFIDTVEKAQHTAEQIRLAAQQDNARPLVFSTLVDDTLRAAITVKEALYLDFFEVFIGPLEVELGKESSHTIGRSHSVVNFNEYKLRIDAVNYAMSNDDGIQSREFKEADVILVGVSRSGKTPTCLYMALQYGIKAANYPLIPEDFNQQSLPAVLAPYRNKLYGLTINPERLHQIRNERKPNSRYAAVDNCKFEVVQAELLMKREGIPFLNTTTKSIEELASTIVHEAKLTRQIF